jgi:hypothetical protein
MPTAGLCRVVWVAAGEAGERYRARGISGALIGRDRRCPGLDVVSGQEKIMTAGDRRSGRSAPEPVDALVEEFRGVGAENCVTRSDPRVRGGPGATTIGDSVSA